MDNIIDIYKGVKEENWAIGEPYQFGDIGYLSHMTDVGNHQIEFIQKTFKESTQYIKEKGTALGLLTIRTKDPIKSIKFFEEILGLKLFVRMYVDKGNGFTLYFLGNENLSAPNPDIDAVENREWMYQQNHLFIEIQHYWNSEFDPEFSLNSNLENGLQTINFSGDETLLKEKLKANNILYKEDEDSILFKTVDEHLVLFTNKLL